MLMALDAHLETKLLSPVDASASRAATSPHKLQIGDNKQWVETLPDANWLSHEGDMTPA